MKKNHYLYEKIYYSIKADILSGQYQIGQQIPTEKELMELFSVSRLTVKNAINLLAEEGIVQRTSGKGTFVSQVPTVEAEQPKQQKNNIIGCVLSGFSDAYGALLLKQLIDSFEQENHHVIIKFSRESQQRETDYIEELSSLGVAGLIVLPVQAEYFNPTLLKIALTETPLVLLDRRLTGLDVPFVGSNNQQGAYQALTTLIENGHQNIAVVSNTSATNSAFQDRLTGIRNAFSDQQLAVNEKLWLSDLNSNYATTKNSDILTEDIKKIQTHLTNFPEITSFFALDYLSAQLIYYALKTLGKTIPEDYSLIGFDGSLQTFLTPSFSRVVQNEQAIAEQGAHMLLDKIKQKTLTTNQVIIDTSFIDGGTIQKI